MNIDSDVPSQDASTSRRSFLTASAGLGAAALAGFGTNSPAQAATAAFPGSRAEFKAAFQSIRTHENAHVAFLLQALGNSARPKPTFQNLQQSTLQNFITTARAFENTGAGAYTNAAGIIFSRNVLASAGSIALVEGRHAGFLNVATAQPITVGNNNFERILDPRAVGAAVQPYIVSLNGGPPLTYSTNRSDTNDIAILNFALALEYLEADFYNINVPKFYP